MVQLRNNERALRTYHVDHEGPHASISPEVETVHAQATRTPTGVVGTKKVKKTHPAVLSFMPLETVKGLDESVLDSPEVTRALQLKLLTKV